MFYCINKVALLIIAPVVVVQYSLAVFCLLKLIYLSPTKNQFLAWNLFILLAVFVGIITFLICYYGFREKVFNVSLEKQKTDGQEIHEAIDKNKTDE